MTWDQFVQQAEASPFTWEIMGEYNDLRFEGVDENQAMKMALAKGQEIEDEAYGR